jgi:hypothetical protein
MKGICDATKERKKDRKKENGWVEKNGDFVSRFLL